MRTSVEGLTSIVRKSKTCSARMRIEARYLEEERFRLRNEPTRASGTGGPSEQARVVRGTEGSMRLPSAR